VFYTAIGAAATNNNVILKLFYTNTSGDTTTEYVLLESTFNAIPDVVIANTYATPNALSTNILQSGSVVDT